MTALVFNTRRQVFADARVREALIYLFDFEWINRTLYAGLYRRTQSYFERSILASAGRPADARERELLAPFPDAVKPAFMEGTYRFPSTDGSGRSRENQEKAFRLLQEAGYELRGRPAGRSQERPPARVRDPCLVDIAGGAAAVICARRRASRHQGEAARRRRRAVSAAADQLRLRHDPEHVVLLAVAGQRAIVPLVHGGGKDARAPIISPASRIRRRTP